MMGARVQASEWSRSGDERERAARMKSCRRTSAYDFFYGSTPVGTRWLSIQIFRLANYVYR